MTGTYLKLILRDLLKRKSFTLINVLGLTLGFVVSLIIVLYVYTELSFDKHIPDAKHKYRIVLKASNEQKAILPGDLKEILEPQLPKGSCLSMITSSNENSSNSVFVQYDKNYYKCKNIQMADAQFLSMFGTSLLQGSPVNLQATPNQVILSYKTALKIFGEQYSVGKNIKIGGGNYTVAGVFKDLAQTTHLNADIVLMLPLKWKLDFDPANSWGYSLFNYYVSLPDNTNISQVESSIRKLYLANHPNYAGATEKEKSEIAFALEPITDIHLNSESVLWDNDKNKGNYNIVVVYMVIGILILLMAAFNYINLSLAYFQTRNTLSGIQKVFGASSLQLFKYIYMQTIGLVVISFILALVLVKVLLPFFNTLASSQMSYSLLYSPVFIGISLLVMFLMILLAGFYPAVSFSRDNPIKVIQKKFILKNKLTGISLRKVMVIAQFAISIALISVILIMGNQIKMMSSQRLGFDSEQLIEINTDLTKKEYDALKTRIGSLPSIVAISAANTTPGDYIGDGFPFCLSYDTQKKDKAIASVVKIEPNYFELMNIKQLEGLPLTSASENKDGAIISKSAAKALGLLNPIGKKISTGGDKKDHVIMGLVDDVQYRSFRETPKSIIYCIGIYVGRPVIRLAKGNPVTAVNAVKKEWYATFPEKPFDFTFFDSKIEKNYASEINALKLLNILGIISILISSLGILGLIYEIANQRIKEIGVRKINGAKVSEVMVLLNIDFVKWVAIAFVIATPISWYVMNKWLEGFAYKTDLSWWIFALAGTIALSIALFTVSWQSWKAATRNPVEALRSE